MIEKKFFTGELNLNYVEVGQGEPLLLLHGGTDCYQDYLPMIPHLVLRYHVYAIDFRGHGGSDQPTSKYKLNDFVTDITVFIEQCIGKAVVLYGHSLGGLVAIMLTAQSSNLVHSLILADPAIFIRKFKDFELFWKGWNYQEQFAGSEKTVLELARAMANNPLGDKTNPVVPTDVHLLSKLLYAAKCLKMVDSRFIQEFRDEFDSFIGDYEPVTYLRKITCPVLLLQADPKLVSVLTEEEIATILQRVPDCWHIILTGIDHGMHSSGKEQVLEILVRFLDAVD